MCNNHYPMDKFGCYKLPDYTKEYLKKHGKKLFEILMNNVPATILSELIVCLEKNKEIKT